MQFNQTKKKNDILPSCWLAWVEAWNRSSQGIAAFMFLAYSSTLFNPSSGEAASPNCLTIALPMITPSAPQPAICIATKLLTKTGQIRSNKNVALSLIHLLYMLWSRYAKANSNRFVCNL